MHGSTEHLAGVLGFFYLSLAAMNGVAALWLWQRLGKVVDAVVWLAVGMGMVLMAAASFGGAPPGMPAAFKALSNLALSGNVGAITYSVGTTLGLIVLYVFRRFFVKPVVAWTLLNASLVL